MWAARNKDESLIVFFKKPIKQNEVWVRADDDKEEPMSLDPKWFPFLGFNSDPLNVDYLFK